MKIQCLVAVINRNYNNLATSSNISPKYQKSTLAIGKEPKADGEYFILHFSANNKTGKKYILKCLRRVFNKYVEEGKATLSFNEPPHDLSLKCDKIQLKSFMKLLKSCVTGNTKELKLGTLSSLSVTAKDNAPTKLTIYDRSEFPPKGFPRTLLSLQMSGLKLYNFRRDILLLRQLTTLDLSNNEIEKIPAELGHLPNLSDLNLANNKLGVSGAIDWKWLLGPQISKALKQLNLNGNQLTYLPKALWKLGRLVTLNAENNKLRQLPATIGRISTLRYLYLSQNLLESLPCSLTHCRLEYIDVSYNENFNQTAEEISTNKHSPWNLYIGSLVHLSSKVVLRYRQYYACDVVPWTLVEFLDNANMCVCGAPVVNNYFHIIKKINLKDYFSSVVSHAGGDCVVFECYFCSPKCFDTTNKYRR